MNRLSLFLFAFFICSFEPAISQEPDVTLTGETSGIEDGTYLYFRDLVNGGDLDSAVVQNDGFIFETRLPEPAMFVMLYSKDRSHFTEVWLEEGTMAFDATGVNFKQAKITGSENQHLFEEANAVASKGLTEEERKQWEQDFVKENRESIVSAFVLYNNLQKLRQDEVADAFQNFSEEVKSSSLGERIRGYLEKDIPEVGEAFTDFSVPNTGGELVKLSELRGQITLLQFWSSSCPVSRTMNKQLTALYREHKEAGFEIISISKDTSGENWLQAIEEDELLWPQLSNLRGWDGEVFSAYGIHATPSNFLIDNDGIIVSRNLRGAELKTAVKQLME